MPWRSAAWSFVGVGCSVVHVGGETIVEGDLGGAAEPELRLHVAGHLTLGTGDFVL
jgi:hypothetical protein